MKHQKALALASAPVRRDAPVAPADADAVQRARFALRIGRRARISAEVSVTSTGVLAIGALVSAILLSSAVIVRTAQQRDD